MPSHFLSLNIIGIHFHITHQWLLHTTICIMKLGESDQEKENKNSMRLNPNSECVEFSSASTAGRGVDKFQLYTQE
ncbi:unnamed protein product [Rhodiola kirilowii]